MAHRVHELVLCKTIEPNRSREIERLQRAGYTLIILAHVKYPIEICLSEVYPSVVKPLLPIPGPIFRVFRHFALLTVVHPGD